MLPRDTPKYNGIVKPEDWLTDYTMAIGIAGANRCLAVRLLGTVVISKKFPRTRKIMVRHSNERGECCPRTLVDRKRKC